MTTAKEKYESKKLPMMPIRDVVIFPFMMTPFVVGRESSVRALEEALAADKKIFLATQHDASIDEPKANEIYQVGTIVNIVQSLKLPDGNIIANDDLNHRVIVIDKATKKIIWQYGVTGRPGSQPGFLAIPDGIDLQKEQ